MATRRLPQNDLYLVITNVGTTRVAVAGKSIGPGQSGNVGLRHVAGVYSRCVNLASLVEHGKIAVAMQGAGAGLVGAVKLTSQYLRCLQASSSGLLGMPPVLAGADRPVATQVPEGFAVYNETTSVPNFSDGAAYFDAVGAPA